VEGLVENGGVFRRTPKRGDAASEPRERVPRLPVAELILALFFAAALAVFAAARQWVSLPFILLFLSGYSWVALAALGERVSYAKSAD